MKFKIVRSKFAESLKNVQNVVSNKGSLPILQNVKLEAQGNTLSLLTTDLDLSVISICECEVEESGATTLPVKLISNMIASLAEGVIEVSVDQNDRAVILAGNAKFRIAGMPENKFPKMPEETEVQEYKIQQTTFREMLRKVSYAASQDDTRRTLKGVLMSFKENKLTMVATDGRRLALVEQELEFPKEYERDIVLPFKAVQELQRAQMAEGEMIIKVIGKQISFSFGNVTVFSKMIEDTYPNYKQVIPTETKETIYVDRNLLIDALIRASVMTLDEAHSTKLTFSEGKLTVSSAASDIGEAKDELPIKYAGETIESIFNPNYIMDVLKAIDDDEIIINLNDGHSPAIIHCSVPFLYVLMPLRVS